MAALVMVLPLAQRLLSLPSLLKLLDRRPVRWRIGNYEPERLVRLTQGLLKQNVGMFRPNCLKQSLILFYFLRSSGWRVTILFGVSKDGGRLASHCWLEFKGAPIGETDDPRTAFEAIYVYPSPTSEADPKNDGQS